jgi:hypothetical protein
MRKLAALAAVQAGPQGEQRWHIPTSREASGVVWDESVERFRTPIDYRIIMYRVTRAGIHSTNLLDIYVMAWVE